MVALLFGAGATGAAYAQSPALASSSEGKTFIDYFLPTPILSPLSSTAWGAATVGPRDQKNGLEDPTMKLWDYWDGQIIYGPDGKYHIFASRWDQSFGHNAWFRSKAVHAISDNLIGPYIDKGLCWPDDQQGKGHNVTALVLPDGQYAIVVSESRPGDVFESSSLDGPWKNIGRITLVPNQFSANERMSNVSIMVRPDGAFEVVPRSGRIWISKTGILGPYTVQGPPIYTTIAELAVRRPEYLEDPVIWFSGELFHIIVNDWNDRKAFLLTSVDGIHDWTFRGLAYDPRRDFVRYTDGTVNHWYKMERPGVLLEKGHVVAVTLAVIDVPKDEEKGNDGHGSRVIVVPFDGSALDRDLQQHKQRRLITRRYTGEPLFCNAITSRVSGRASILHDGLFARGILVTRMLASIRWFCSPERSGMPHLAKLRNLPFAFLLLIATAQAALAHRLEAQTVRLEAEDAQLVGANLHAVRPGSQSGSQPSAPAAAPGASAGSGNPPAPVTGYSGQGYVSGLGDPTSKIVMSYAAPEAGIYDVRIGYRCPNRCAYQMQVNDLAITSSFSPRTPGFFEVQKAGKVELQAGANTLVLTQGWGGYDVDYLELSPSAPILPPARPASAPSDPHITPEARALLQTIVDHYGHGTMMGVYSDGDAQYVLDTTGFLPAIMGADLSTYSPASMERHPHPSEIVERMIAHAHDGYILTFSWHWVPPFGLLNRVIPGVNGKPPIDARWNRGFYTNATKFDVSIAMDDPQSMERAYLLRDIDAIAAQLRKLQDAHVPVLWRPLHEAQGGWFWWGAQGPQPFIQLWQLLYDRLVNVDGIHNLLWVYTSADDPAWYPGDAYVDAIGVDAYPKDLRDPQSELWEQLIAQFAGKKPVTLSEFGGVPDIARMRRLGVDWSYAVSWNGSEGPRKNTPEALKQIYANQWALKRTASSGSKLKAVPQ